jgi:predicted RND superfamily exporter protein
MTTVILVLGFLPFASTAYLSTRMIGLFVPLALVVAVLADLLLVPALLAVSEPGGDEGTPEGAPSPS